MTKNDNLTEILKSIDPAPMGFSAHVEQHNLAVVRRRIRGSHSPTPSPVRWRGLAIASSVLVGAASVVATLVVAPLPDGQPLPPPYSATPAANAVAVGATVDDFTVLASTSVGSTQYVIAEKNDIVQIGQLTNGSLDGWMSYSSTPPARDLIVAASGHSPGIDTIGIADVSGRVGESVASVTVITRNGLAIEAIVANGWFVAAWEGDDFSSKDTLGQSFVIELRDGTVKTIAGEAVPSF